MSELSWPVGRIRRGGRLALAVLDAMPDTAIVVLDARLRVVMARGAAWRRHGWDVDALEARPAAEALPPAMWEQLERPLHAALGGKADAFDYQATDGERIYRTEVVPLRDPATDGITGAVCYARDVTEERRARAALRALADRDPLTALRNRRRFADDLGRQLARCRRHGEPAALLVMDLDGFKAINDTFGHRAGDEVLRAVAATLERRMRHSDVIARLGGDEFAVLLTHVGADEARSIADEIERVIADTVAESEGTRLQVSASVGVAALDGAVADAEAALAAADVAMYERKAHRAGG